MEENQKKIKKLIDFIIPYVNKKLTKNNFLTIQNKNINPIHISIEKMIKNKIVIPQRQISDWKPEGIWASHDFNLENNNYTWLNFCYSEGMYNWINPLKNNYYTFELKKNAKIYILESNKKSLEKFINIYKFTKNKENIQDIQKKLKKEAHRTENNLKLIEKIFTNLINWEKLQNNGYDGIYFVKYKKFNKDLPYWFSTIDASSLCVWNPFIIKKFKKIDLTKYIEKFEKNYS
jgi:hypothetical protein